VPHFLDAFQGMEFLLGANPIDIEGIEIAVDELDRLEQAARCFAFPDFAKAAAAQGLDEAVARDRFCISLSDRTHDRAGFIWRRARRVVQGRRWGVSTQAQASKAQERKPDGRQTHDSCMDSVSAQA